MGTKQSEKTLLRDFFLGFVRIHILHHASEEPIFGAGITRELARHGYKLSPGTLYPLLHQMEKRGFLKRRDEVVSGRRRKYYRCTPVGKKALARAKVQVSELVGEVM
jgi:PadR family transcriptional regulator PadR